MAAGTPDEDSPDLIRRRWVTRISGLFLVLMLVAMLAGSVRLLQRLGADEETQFPAPGGNLRRGLFAPWLVPVVGVTIAVAAAVPIALNWPAEEWFARLGRALLLLVAGFAAALAASYWLFAVCIVADRAGKTRRWPLFAVTAALYALWVALPAEGAAAWLRAALAQVSGDRWRWDGEPAPAATLAIGLAVIGVAALAAYVHFARRNDPHWRQVTRGALALLSIWWRFLGTFLRSPLIFVRQTRVFFISARYLSKRLICVLSMVVIALGVMVLIVVSAVMTGFQGEFRERLRGTLSHLTVQISARRMGREIEPRPDEAPEAFLARRYRHIDQRIEALRERVLAAAPAGAPYRIEGASLRFEGLGLYIPDRDRATPVQLVGVDPRRDVTVAELPSYLEQGLDEYFRASYLHYVAQYEELLELTLRDVQTFEGVDAAPLRALYTPLFHQLRVALGKGRKVEEVPALFDEFGRGVRATARHWPAAQRPRFDRALAPMILDDGARWRAWLAQYLDEDRGTPKFERLVDPALFRLNRPYYQAAGEVIASFAIRDGAGRPAPGNPLYAWARRREELRALTRDRLPFDAPGRARPTTAGIFVGLEFYKLLLRRPIDRDEYHAADAQVVPLVTGTRQTSTAPEAPPIETVSRQFEIVGVFKTGIYELDKSGVYMSLDAARDFQRPLDEEYALGVKLDRPEQARAAQADLARALAGSPYGHEVLTWEDLRKNLMEAVNMERLLLMIIISVLLIFAGMAIAIIILLMVYQKTRDIGVFNALGAHADAIVALFLYNGFIIGVVGAFLGINLGLMIVSNLKAIVDWLDRTLGWNPFPPDIYYLTEIPSEIDPLTIVQVALFAIGICYFWSVLPAFIASRKDPVQALHYE